MEDKVAYIPRDRILGLSKVHRIVDHLARRPQVQERLTVQCAEVLRSILLTDDLAVRIRARHGCIFAAAFSIVRVTW
jgi:GTP cyclohydrolase IA